MAILALKVLDKDSNTICVSSGEDFVDLVCTHTYEEGDRIVLETDEKNIHVHLQVDDALGDAFVYITDNVSYYVPFGEKRISMSPKVFSGNKHYLYAEVAREDEITAYRNLALNPADQHMRLKTYIPMPPPMWRPEARAYLQRKTPLTVSGRTAPTENGPTNPGESTCRMMQL